jgi:DNA-directed RNA polymerase specialized sigma24 family protein
VWDVVRALPDRQRMAVVLRYVADLAEDDIAVAMGVTRGTVASTLAAARRSLAALLAEPDVAEEPS